jgi:hypothetical protein
MGGRGRRLPSLHYTHAVMACPCGRVGGQKVKPAANENMNATVVNANE